MNFGIRAFFASLIILLTFGFFISCDKGGDTVITYSIGETGPGGGLVFYDKGNYNDGWRYLEAAPVSAEVSLRWGPDIDIFNNGPDDDETFYDDIIFGTWNNVGAGKDNTATIVKLTTFLEPSDTADYAARYCKTLDSGGQNDWFLPSLDELKLMYQNLKTAGVGDFGSVMYWSSTQESGNVTTARAVNFSDGYSLATYSKATPRLVRPVRAFM